MEKAAALRMLPLLLKEEGVVVKACVVETAMAAERITGNNFMVDTRIEWDRLLLLCFALLIGPFE